MRRTKGASGGARLPLSARFAKSERHSQPLSAFLVAFALWGHVAGRWHPLLWASDPSFAVHRPVPASVTHKEGRAELCPQGNRGKWQIWSGSGVLTVFECEGLKLIWIPEHPCPTVPFRLTISSHPCLQKDCVDMYWNAGDGTNGISLPATALRSPNSGVKLPLLVSPLISYGNDAFCPCTCCPHIKLRQDRRHCTLWSIFFPCCCIEHLFHVTSNHLISNSCSPLTYEDFLKCSTQSDNYGKLALEELSFLLPIFGWRCFYNLLQWSAIKQELHNWLNAVCSQEALAVQADLRTALLLLRHPGTDRWASHRKLACSSPGGRSWLPAASSRKTQSSSHKTHLACPTLPANTQACAASFELGTSRLEFSSATSCVQNLVYKISKGNR